ncbi:6061_t:CDS:2, partial [Gigaspora margarita]
QRNSYTVEEKRKAVELARRTSNANAERHYSLDLAMLGCWVKKFSQDPSFSSQRNSLRVSSRRRIFFPEEEAKLYEWITEVHRNSLAVTYSSIKLKMAEILDKSIKQTNDMSKKWILNGGNGLTEKRNLKRADLNTEDISEDIIIRSFKKYGISNCLSGSKDHLIYESDEDSEEEDSDENNEDSNENDKDSDKYEDENSEETGDEDSNKNEYENSDENEGEYSGKDDEESNKDNNESDDGDKSNNKMSEYSKWPECFVYID